MHATIYHNPDCGTSRNTLALLRHAGFEPQIVLYLQTPPGRARLQWLLEQAGLAPSQAIRRQGTPFQQLGLDAPETTEEQLLEAMLAHPILINRPFVVTTQGVRLCRPSERVLEILPPLASPFTKEDGEVVGG